MIEKSHLIAYVVFSSYLTTANPEKLDYFLIQKTR